MRVIVQIVGLVIVSAGTWAWGATPESASEPTGGSFACGRAATRIERLVCGDATLAALDSQLVAAYQQRLAQVSDPESLRARQRTWLRDVWNRCGDAACLKTAYQRRLDALEGVCEFFRRYTDAPDVAERQRSNPERYLGEMCASRSPERCEDGRPQVALSALQVLGLSADEPRFKSLLADNWVLHISWVDIDNDGVDELRVSRTVGTAHCTHSYFFKRTTGGTLASIENPDYELLHEDGRFCQGDLRFVRQNGAVYTVEVYDAVATVWLGSSDGLQEVCHFQ